MSYMHQGELGLSIAEPKMLRPEFFLQHTVDVAKGLLGKVLVRERPIGTSPDSDGEQRVCWSGRIVEVEAYLGLQDPACHSYGGRRTVRTEALYQPGGYSYVYFIYGMYFCFNVVTGDPERPEAVLIRALEPLAGIEQQTQNRNSKTLTRPLRPRDLANGPGKLCQALQIDKSLDRLCLYQPGGPIYICDDVVSEHIYNKNINQKEQIVCGPRVGIEGAGKEAASWPLRFALKDHPCVSRPVIK